MIIGAFIAVFTLMVGVNSGFQTMGYNSIKGALADLIITKTCPDCKGTGVIYIKKRCYSCPDGVEKVPVTCSTCNGTGKITVRKSTN